MRLLWTLRGRVHGDGDRSVPRRPVRLLVHAEVARQERPFLAALVEAGCGLLVIADAELEPGDLPSPGLRGQVTVLAPLLPSIWCARTLPDLAPWQEARVPAGVLAALAPTPHPEVELPRMVEEACSRGAAFVLAVPLAVPAADRHRLYDRLAGEAGDPELENLLFHGDPTRQALEMEREASRACAMAGLRQGLPGPATALAPEGLFAAAASILLWARRLDLLDGVESQGWQLRRAAGALVAAGRDPLQLVAEDNLRIVPGFTPWVEAFCRALWAGAGEPFDDANRRWACS
jgi:hypothetical protein